MNKKEDRYKYLGSCLCGSIKYSVSHVEEKMAHCHCNMCRKFHGAAFATFGEAKKADFNWLSGEELIKEYLADNGTKRLFCSNCGSSLVFVPSNDSGEYVEFSLGTIDSEIQQKPDAHIFTNYGANWYQITDDLPQYEEDRNSAKKT
ncbi:GFA family protein [Vibrio salinus]|uniref:GFA family protein n=1 Tax=Vibrio salinus TaxID=2899784 RepID=UPI001E606595|nr:GFA family protein [Vibrio salinus]MCE0495445.1 GFA family protein [Vibrio salinus]